MLFIKVDHQFILTQVQFETDVTNAKHKNNKKIILSIEKKTQQQQLIQL